MPQSMVHSITLTNNARHRLISLSEAKGEVQALRVEIEGGGCSGFQYKMELVDVGLEGDIEISNGKARAYVDSGSLALMDGSIIDFVEELIGSQFVIINPKAKSACGCGVSFSLA